MKLNPTFNQFTSEVKHLTLRLKKKYKSTSYMSTTKKEEGFPATA